MPSAAQPPSGELFVEEVAVLAWIGPADAEMIAYQHGVRSEEETVQRLADATELSLIRVLPDGQYALTDKGYAVLQQAIDGES